MPQPKKPKPRPAGRPRTLSEGENHTIYCTPEEWAAASLAGNGSANAGVRKALQWLIRRNKAASTEPFPKAS